MLPLRAVVWKDDRGTRREGGPQQEVSGDWSGTARTATGRRYSFRG
jgi:hypothetical protein